MVCSSEELRSPRLVCGWDFPNFEMSDAKIASALKNIIKSSQFKKKVSFEEQKVKKEDRLLRRNLMRWFYVTMFSDWQTQQVLGNHFLMEAKIICLIKQDLNELVWQKHQVGSVDNCIEELQHQANSQKFELQDTQHGNIGSRKEQSRMREKSSMKEKADSPKYSNPKCKKKSWKHHKNSYIGSQKKKEQMIFFAWSYLLQSYLGPSEYCGSINKRVSTVGFLLVSCSLCLHIFALASCLNRASLIHLAHRFLSHPCSSRLRILVLPIALDLTSMVLAPSLGAQRMKSSYSLKRRSRRILNVVSSSSHIPNEYRAICGDVLTLEKVKSRYKCFSGVSSWKREKEKGLLYCASRNPRFSSMASRTGRPRWKGSSFENLRSRISYEIASWRTEEASVWSTIRDEFARIKGRKRRQGPPRIKAAGMLGHSDGSTATWSLGSHGPVSFDDKIGTRDTDLRPSQALRMNMCEVPSYFGSRVEHYHIGVLNWINSVCEKSNMPAYDKPVRIHCKTGSLSARRVFEIRAICQDFVAGCKDDDIPYEIDGPFWQSRTNIAVGQRKSLEDREIWETICAPVESLGLKARSSLPWRRWHRYIHCPCSWRPSTSS